MPALTEYREDIGSEITSRLDENGYLRIDGIAAKVGVLTYLKADGTMYKELVTPEALFHEDSLKSLIGSPVTIGHSGLLTPDTSAEHTRGNVPAAREDDGKLRVDVVVTASDAIKTVMSGARQLSPGYRAKLDNTPGEWNGQRYDAKQVKRIYNHLALVTSARGGSECKLNLDGMSYAVEVDPTKEGKTMAHSVKLRSGATVEVSDASTATALQTEINDLGARADSAETMISKADHDALQGKHDAVESELKALKEQSSIKLDADEIGSYIDTLDKAKKLKSDIEYRKDGAYLTKTELMAAAIGVDAKDKSEDYISGRFDSAVELSKNTELKNQREDGNDPAEPVMTGKAKFMQEQLKRGV